MMRMLFLLACFCATTSLSSTVLKVWHITDVHVDPYYTPGADATSCYCEIKSKCPEFFAPGTCIGLTNESSAAAGVLGNSEGNCATPKTLFESALAFMRQQQGDTPLIYFTGDFSEAGASAPCSGTGAEGDRVAQQQILDITTYDWLALRDAMPQAKMMGCLGNHDTHPGDVFYGTQGPCPAGACQQWQYDNLTTLWGPDLDHDQAALTSLKRGAYYAARPLPGLTVIALNINYWCTQNPQATDVTTSAHAEGLAQFAWLAKELAAAETRGDAVHLLGHQPPSSKVWIKGYYAQYMTLSTRYKDTIKGQFFGHIHVDEWSLTRECVPVGNVPWIETSHIKWCSGGGDWQPGPIFGAGTAGPDGSCPRAPAAWSDDQVVRECEAACANETTCVGFTLYDGKDNNGLRNCCFRTVSTANKPACANCTARCFEKPDAVRCDGAATGIIIPGPALTEGFPATNPALRLLTFDAESFALLEIETFFADLHAGNNATPTPALTWQLEYDFRHAFDMPDLSPASFEALHARMSTNGSATWEAYRGQGNGALYCTRYDSGQAGFAPHNPCEVCEGDCKTEWIAHLNGTATPP